MSTTTAHHAMPRIAGARVIFTLLAMAAIASLLLGTCANRVTHKSPSSASSLRMPASDPRASAIHQLEQLGLDPQVQTAPGGIHNIVARKYGSASDREVRPALLIAAGYGQAPAIGAALRHAAPFANDLIFMFADGQPGREAFARYHPWARDAGVVLRLEGGGASALLTHARGGDTGQLQDWMARTSASLGSSALHALSVRRSDGFDAIGESALTVSGAAPDAILALARHYADAPLDGIGTGPRVHFWLPLAGQVAYDEAFVRSTARITALALLLACCVAWRHAGLRLPQLAAAALCNVLLAAGLLTVGLVVPRLPPFAAAGAPLQFAAMSAGGAALFVTLHRLLLARLGTHATVLGTLLALLAALAAAAIALPEVSYLLAWPLLAALGAYGAAQLPLSLQLRRITVAAAAAPPLLLFVPLLTQLAPIHSAAFMLALTALLGFCCVLIAALKLGRQTEAGLP